MRSMESYAGWGYIVHRLPIKHWARFQAVQFAFLLERLIPLLRSKPPWELFAKSLFIAPEKNMDKYAVILVFAASHAIFLEKLLSQAGIESKMVPVPRHLSSDCGICIRISRNSLTEANRIVVSTGLDIIGIYGI